LKKKIVVRFIVDCTHPVEDGIMDPASFEKYLHDKVKATKKSRPGVLRDLLTIGRDKSKITLTSKGLFSKKYLKFLTKKYLKKQQLRDWLRVVAPTSAKDTYELKYYNIHDDDASADE